ncbi:MAG: CRISPR-associated protein, Cmr5 family [Thermococcales archaeon 44_46]|jgi:CRISPR-associated protein Cmr5|uniref:type III-B CRISPR module-associated protein Cmr5 n=1 Tax=Thermococcus sp. PK TaxID=913025 RepID=UPI0005B2834C|nr:type III-B CRISPR module-associated protein Cmr5 [Thermococcus sp. PK]KUK00289.1 MAG: CRISPR-associated protein, Cmr5 family [Thermococcales archaeon 44_46]MDK2782932.1 CRISPR-associated protein Cmr5 [Thermococcaceae archaeon]MDK2982634.1 CRISPR-associated protein Cmr5 [Thermococcaceae archaeon]HIH73374.1 type III-B CRISPR module-associated protein Cmr5 [Thermococcaceae archaeon]
MALRSLEQKRAKFAYEAVTKVKEISNSRDKNIQKKYASYVKSAPALILTNGLPSTLAFYLSKIKEGETEYTKIKEELEKFEKGEKAFENKAERIAYAYLFYQISEWLAKRSPNRITEGMDPLQYMLKESEVQTMIHLTRETIKLLSWMRRFADAMLEKEE